MKFNVLPTIFEHNTLHECEIKKAREIERATKAYHDDKKSTKGLPFFKRVSIFFKGMISAPVNAALESDTLYGGYVGFGSAIIGTLSVVGLDIGVAIFASYVVNNAGMEGIVRLLAVIGT